MPATIDLKDLTPAQRKELKLRAPRRQGMTMHEVRTAAIRVLGVIAELTPSERGRVLRHAAKLNEV
jgi:hypothetical protein